MHCIVLLTTLFLLSWTQIEDCVNQKSFDLSHTKNWAEQRDFINTYFILNVVLTLFLPKYIINYSSPLCVDM